MSVPGIYLITNTENGKVYVGKARKISMRWSVHRHHLTNGTHHCRALQGAWLQYGADAFEFSVVIDLSDTDEDSLDTALALEEARVFSLHKNTYNSLMPTEDGQLASQETRELLSIMRKRAWLKAKTEAPEKLEELFNRIHTFRRSEEGRRIFSQQSLERWADPAFKERLSKLSSEKWERPGYREKHTAHLQSAWLDPEKRANRIAGIKQAWADPEIRARRLAAIREGQARALADPDSKIHQRAEKRWADPNANTHMAKKATEGWSDPDIRERRLAAIKAAWADPEKRTARLAKREAKRAAASLPTS